MKSFLTSSSKILSLQGLKSYKAPHRSLSILNSQVAKFVETTIFTSNIFFPGKFQKRGFEDK